VNAFGFDGLPECYQHGDDPAVHKPAHCTTEGTFHGVVCAPKKRVVEAVVQTTHRGRLSAEARERRASKNAANRRRKAEGNALHKRGSQRKRRHA
jgi:hypothetical protein